MDVLIADVVQADGFAWGALLLGASVATNIEQITIFNDYLIDDGSMAPRGGYLATPLGNLCLRNDVLQLPNFEGMLGYLLNLDSSLEVVGSSIISLITSTISADNLLQIRRLELIINLFDANPESVKYVFDGSNLLHIICNGILDKAIRDFILSYTLTHHCGALIERRISTDEEDGDLPIHIAMEKEDYSFVEILLQANLDTHVINRLI